MECKTEKFFHRNKIGLVSKAASMNLLTQIIHQVHLTQNSETSPPQLIRLNLEGGGMLLEDINVLNFLCQ